MAKANFGGTLRALLRLLSPAPGQIAVEAIALSEACLEVWGHVVANTAACPRCGTCSRRVHSRSTRTLADLPCCGVPVQLSLRVRRFFCDAAACLQRTFVEQVPEAAAPYARRSTRLRATLVPIAFTVGGKPGAAVLRHLHLRAGRDTLLRLIRRTCQGSGAGAREDLPRVVGVDDWAWRRGSRSGTIVCDLECRRPLDLLPDREVASTATWLAAHPRITVVSRDRGGAYADAARQGAPEAVQVADRWHLLKNLGDALEGFLRRERVQLPSATGHSRLALAATPAPGDLTAAAVRIASAAPAAAASMAVTAVTVKEEGAVLPSRRQERFLQVHARQQAGVSIRAIAREFGLARNTVRRYLRAVRCPDWRRPRRRSRLDPHHD
ncbi:MAG TPA: ISL3 family transposase [Ktedonobacterales bacterium]|nr:ISL3 family transposase [Ktedonobacterales bacterium]